MKISDLPGFVRDRIKKGAVIPAMPLALDAGRRFDPKRQRALVRYYLEAGAGGLAVGVHTTQFAIREPRHGLFRPVLEAVSSMIDEGAAADAGPVVKIGGICGRRDQALTEAEFLVGSGYHAGLLSLGALKGDSVASLIAHARAIAEIIPIVGFYLQPDVGGRILPYEFWREFAVIENVLAIKMAPFNRYRTIDVVRGVCDSGREKDVALYTGNDDNIVVDLLTEFRVVAPDGQERHVRVVGGLLGQWCLWTRKAVELLAELRRISVSGETVPARYLTL
ncbi:MAG: dihydrodipicolinate synthase family protein, partial [Spirochaetes bacterium]|nr:dihydrodipicolinate synthase family protein [Spirochaetota bacterium]